MPFPKKRNNLTPNPSLNLGARPSSTSTSVISSSPEKPSQAPGGVSPLPPPRKVGRPQKTPNAPTFSGAAEKIGKVHTGLTKRELPEDIAELDKLTAPYRILVRPLVSGVSHTLEIFDMKPLDADEKESGMSAWSCLLYQYGAKIDAGLLVILWIGGVMAPRLAEIASKKRNKPTPVTAGGQPLVEKRPATVSVMPQPVGSMT